MDEFLTLWLNVLIWGSGITFLVVCRMRLETAAQCWQQKQHLPIKEICWKLALIWNLP